MYLLDHISFPTLCTLLFQQVPDIESYVEFWKWGDNGNRGRSLKKKSVALYSCLRKQWKSNQSNFCLSERQFNSLTVWEIVGLQGNISDSYITRKLPKVVLKTSYILFCTALVLFKTGWFKKEREKFSYPPWEKTV